MKNPRALRNLSLFNRNPGIAEIRAILDLFSEAAILVEEESERITAANTKACELTAFTPDELTQLTLGDLFLEPLNLPESEESQTQPTSIPVSLHKHNQSTETVLAKLTTLWPEGKYALLTFEPLRVSRQRNKERQRADGLMESFETFVDAFSQPALKSSLKGVIQAAHLLTGADVLGVYWQDLSHTDQDLALQKGAVYGKGDRLPQQLPAQELTNLRSPHFWLPGKRSLSSLHRTARSKGYAYVASAPLGDERAMIGLLVAVGDHEASEEELLPYLNITAKTITNLIQRTILVNNLKTEVSQMVKRNALYESIADGVQDGIMLLSPDLTISRINKAAEQILEYVDLDVRGQPVENVLIGTETLIPAFQMAQEGIPTVDLENIRLFRRSGEAFLAQVSVIPAFDEGEIEGIVIFLRDLTEQELAQAQTRQLEQRALLGEVTSIFAHEVRNPINNISTGLQLLAFNLPAEDPNQEVVKRLQEDCDRLAELITSVRSYSRSTDYDMEEVDLQPLISRMIDRLRPRITKYNVSCNLQLQDDLPSIQGNPQALEQVFTNLLENALQAMAQDGGTLSVKACKKESSAKRPYIEISIADSGPGIPKENLDKIFQPFFTTKTDGTGLGLAITKRIITAHKGTVKVESIPGGTIFSVHFPATITAEQEKN